MSSKKLTVAEKALERAIAEQTSEVRGELARANARIAALEALLARIAAMAHGAVQGAVHETPAAPALVLPPAKEPVEEPAPAVELAEADQMGEGRWV